MSNEREALAQRFLRFAADTIKVTKQIDTTFTGRHVGGQLMRSATSSGANYNEACGAESHADFVHKMQIVYKELRESVFWLKLITMSDFSINSANKIQSLTNEAEELVRIIAKSLVTAKKKNI